MHDIGGICCWSGSDDSKTFLELSKGVRSTGSWLKNDFIRTRRERERERERERVLLLPMFSSPEAACIICTGIGWTFGQMRFCDLKSTWSGVSIHVFLSTCISHELEVIFHIDSKFVTVNIFHTCEKKKSSTVDIQFFPYLGNIWWLQGFSVWQEAWTYRWVWFTPHWGRASRTGIPLVNSLLICWCTFQLILGISEIV